MATKPTPYFKAATFNVYHSSSAAKLRPNFKRLARENVTVILLQEFQQAATAKMVREEGWALIRGGNNAIAYRPEVWAIVGKSQIVELSPQPWLTQKGYPMRLRSPRTVLRHKATGRTVDVVSYHTPPTVQRPNAPKRRIAATRAAMKTLSRFGKQSTAKGHAVLYGGDDNVDEARYGHWGFMRMPATGLRQVRPPLPTHGNRRIDDFRIRGLKVANKGSVWPTASDHRVHTRRFQFS